jgi:hypothetical protein
MKYSLLIIFLTALSVFGLILADNVNSAPDLPITVSASNVVSTIPSVTWIRTYNGNNSGSVVIQTADGGFLLGSATVPFLDNNVELLKVDSSGNLQWRKKYGGSGNFLGKWLIQTNDGNYTMAGQYAGNFWLAKIDTSGNLLWDQTYNGLGFSWASGLVQTSDGGYVLIGQTNSTMGQKYSSSIGANGVIWLLKTDAMGNEQWNKTLGDGTVNSVIETSDGGYALVGGTAENEPDYLLIKTDSIGSLQWSKRYGSQDKDFSYAVVQTADGGYALGGWMWLRSNGSELNMAITKVDIMGNLQWTQYYGAGQSWAMVKTSDKGFVLAGTSLVKADAEGNYQWQISLEENNFSVNDAHSVIQTNDGGYAVTGGSSSLWLARINLIADINQTVTPSSPIHTSLPGSTPSPSVPEFPLWILLSTAITATMFMIIIAKKTKA